MNLSFNQYRAIDLTIMAVLLAVPEALIALGATKWFPEIPYVLSPTVAIVCIVMMRWNGFAVIHAALGGVVLCMASGATAEQFAVYAAGNCGILIAMVMFKLLGKQRVADNPIFSVLYTALAFVGAQVGRALIGLAFGESVWEFVRYVTTDSLSLLFAVIVVLVARRMDGLFEDQKSYLIRVDKERREEQRLHDNEDFM